VAAVIRHAKTIIRCMNSSSSYMGTAKILLNPAAVK